MDLDITKVYIKGAPVQMEDFTLCAWLNRYGKIVPNSMIHHTVKGFPNIRNGARTVEMTEVTKPIPRDISVMGFDLSIQCDNGKTECRFCDSTDHPFYQCPDKNRPRCHTCGSFEHLKASCPKSNTNKKACFESSLFSAEV